MNDFYKRIYKATEEQAQEFKRLCVLLRGNKLQFTTSAKEISKIEDLLPVIYHFMYEKNKLIEVYADKTLRFFQILNKNAMLFKNIFAMQIIFHLSLVDFKRGLRYNSRANYGDIIYDANSKAVKFSDLFPYFRIKIIDIFKINSDWNDFPENLHKHKLQITKIFYKSLKESMIDRIEYYYSESNRFFGKWKKREIEFISEKYGWDSDKKVNTLRVFYDTLEYLSCEDNTNASDVLTALDNVLERIFLNQKQILIKMSPINFWYVLEGMGEDLNPQEMEEVITESLFCERDDL